MKISTNLQNAHSIEDVVEMINNGGTSEYDDYEISAQYAWDAAGESGYGITIENTEAHLEALEEAGADFSVLKALNLIKLELAFDL